MIFRRKKQLQHTEPSVTLGRRERNLLVEDVHIEEELLPSYMRTILLTVVILLVLFFVWAWLTTMQEVARAQGEIIPFSNVNLVQHLDGGIVEAVSVEERELVQKGDLLLRMDGSQAMAELQRLRARQASLKLRQERLLAFTSNRLPSFSAFETDYPEQVVSQMDLFRQQVATRESTLSILHRQHNQQRERLRQTEEALEVALRHQALTSEMLAMREELAAQNLITRTVLLETRRAWETARGEVQRLNQDLTVLQEEIEETLQRIEDTSNLMQREALAELSAIRAEETEVASAMTAAATRVARLRVVAPETGYVQNLTVLTQGQVVQPGEVMMHIVPDDVTLRAEVRILPRDIGFVSEGQHANLRVTGYDYVRFGYATGRLTRISAFSTIGEDRTPFFRAWITLDKSYIGEVANQYILMPGMSVEAEINIGEKTILVYMLRPVVDGLTRAFGER